MHLLLNMAILGYPAVSFLEGRRFLFEQGVGLFLIFLPGLHLNYLEAYAEQTKQLA